MDGSTVILNVGGTLYTTTQHTLSKFPDSMLGAMVSGQFPSTVDSNGNYFIDRDGEIFRYILNFLRSSRLALPSDFKDYDLLMIEADFFQISPLIDAILHIKELQSPKYVNYNLEIIELRTGSTATMPTNNSRIKTILSGQKNVIITLPEYLIGSDAMEKLAIKNGSDFAEVELIGSNSRLRLGEILRNRGWKLQNSDLSSSSGYHKCLMNCLIVEQSYRDLWSIQIAEGSTLPFHTECQQQNS